QTVAAGGLVTQAEWDAAVDVLVGAYRRRQYPVWKQQETGIVLSPELFQATRTDPPISSYRTDPRAPAHSQATPRARALDRHPPTDGMNAPTAAPEQACLGTLRDALLTDVTAADYSGNTGAASLQLTGRYHVDFHVTGAAPTTRLDQATASLQALL